jgi:hypothetical protein
MHATWNSIIQLPFDVSTTGPGAGLWTGESGILVAATLSVLALASTRFHWPMLRTPPRGETLVAKPTPTDPAPST